MVKLDPHFYTVMVLRHRKNYIFKGGLSLNPAITQAVMFAVRHKANVHVVDEETNKAVFKVMGKALP